MIVEKIFKRIKERISPDYWADRIGEKSGAYDKARNSKLRQFMARKKMVGLAY